MNLDYDKNTITEIKGKRILFFAPAFFGYEHAIEQKMRELGAEVDLYDERSVSKAIDRALLKISPKLFAFKSKKYYKRIIEENHNKDYDYIFVIKGDMIPISTLKEFRHLFPNAKLCLYLYDSVANIPGIKKKLSYFDTCHSFDPVDCSLFPQLKFRPLFFCDSFRKPPKKTGDYSYDICFVGTIHSDRYRIIKEVKQEAEESNLRQKWFLYLQSGFIYYFYKLTKKEFWDTQKDYFDYTKKTSDEIAQDVDCSKVVLDIQHPKQSGLTMRTIEMLGMNKKLITTNSTICKYDFYNPNNILVVDRNRVSLDLDFINSSYQEIDKTVYERYSIETWIMTVLA